jgi:hypothetical protein
LERDRRLGPDLLLIEVLRRERVRVSSDVSIARESYWTLRD